MKTFKWVVEFEVTETWVEDGFEINEEYIVIANDRLQDQTNLFIIIYFYFFYFFIFYFLIFIFIFIFNFFLNFLIIFFK